MSGKLDLACSTDSSSVSAWSSTQTFTTATPCTVPQNTSTSSITLTEATLGWDAVTGAGLYNKIQEDESRFWILLCLIQLTRIHFL